VGTLLANLFLEQAENANYTIESKEIEVNEHEKALNGYMKDQVKQDDMHRALNFRVNAQIEKKFSLPHF